MSEIKYTEGVCEDGAAILSDGRMMTIREVLEALNASEEHRVSLRLSQDSAIRLQHTVDVLRDENTELAESVEDLRAEVERHYNAAAAMKSFNRAAYSLSTALILVALIAAIFAVGLVNEENRLARQSVVNQEANVKW